MLRTLRICVQESKRWLFRLSTTELVALALVSSYLVTLPLLLCAPLFITGQLPGGPDLGKHAVLKIILLGCIAAPIVETAINQWGCLRLLKRLGCRTGVANCISALIFGLCHSYSTPYVLLGILVGAILATVFAIEDARKGHPFLATVAVHALRNGIATAVALFAL